MNANIVPVVLSGGSGTRLWPLSTAERPKQFLPLVTERTLFQDTLLRVAASGSAANRPFVICNGNHLELVEDQLDEIGQTPGSIILEPVGRNTAPAVAMAALEIEAQRQAGLGPANANDLLLILPADHAIRDQDAFADALRVAAEVALAGNLVTFGIVPDRPETGYGYIERGARSGDWFAIADFVEKPDPQTAEACLASGNYFWNSGMFMLPPRLYLDELNRLAPDMLTVCERVFAESPVRGAVRALAAAFADCPADSIDYAVMEHTARAAVVPLDAGWSDVGSWAALYEMLDKDGDGNVVRGQAEVRDCHGCFIDAGRRRLGVAALRDMVVVAAGDSVLVLPLAESQRTKELAK